MKRRTLMTGTAATVMAVPLASMGAILPARVTPEPVLSPYRRFVVTPDWVPRRLREIARLKRGLEESDEPDLAAMFTRMIAHRESYIATYPDPGLSRADQLQENEAHFAAIKTLPEDMFRWVAKRDAQYTRRLILHYLTGSGKPVPMGLHND